jgi:pimeloyl-ACP methyl ester carboxylesterase
METPIPFPIALVFTTLEHVALALVAALAVLVAACGVTMAILLRGYIRIIVHLFLERSQIPGTPDPDARLSGETVEFETADKVKLRGVFCQAPNAQGRTVIFCHEYGSNLNSAARYQKFLLPAGFNCFAFDFRGHGQSGNSNGYEPKQWLTTYEMADLEAAIKYVQGRPDVDPAKIGLFGLSMGACSCICVAGRRDGVKAVVAEGAFATRQILIEGMKRWISVYAILTPVHPWVPDWFFNWLCRVSMRRAEEQHQCRFVAIEEYIGKLSPKPLYMIHGEKDSYVSVAHVQRIFNKAKSPKELWVVPSARHNEGVRVAGPEYEEKVTTFLRQHLN